MSDFHTTVGGQTRRVIYTLDDREAVEEIFTRPDGTPGSLWALATSGSIKALVAVLWGGLRHDESVTLDLCKKWVAEHLKGGGGLSQIMQPVADCILASGVLGFTMLKPEPAEEETGKVPAAIPAAE
jgi:hypothetical protein